MADPSSQANPGFPGRQNQQPFPSPAHSFLRNPQIVAANPSNIMQNPLQIPNMLQSPVMPVPNMPQTMTRPGFSGAANNFIPLQNNQLTPPQMGLLGNSSQLGQASMGFNQGSNANNVNAAVLLSLLGQLVQNAAQVNLSQLQGQLFNPGFMNGPQQQQQQLQQLHQSMSMNMNMPSGQLLAQGLMQNLGQIMSLQGSYPSQVAPAFLPCSQPVLGIPNQVSQGVMPLVANINTNPPFGVGQYNQAGQLLNQNLGSFVPSGVGGNGLNPPIFASQMQGNASSPRVPGLVPNMPPSATTNSEGNPVHNSRTGQFEGRLQKFHSHNMNEAGRKPGFLNKHAGKGSNMKSKLKFECDTPTPENKGQKRYFQVYSEAEIKQWRESRRNNYPSKQNIEKKQKAKLDRSKREAELKNELAEVLSKQAQLGVEVAELPRQYLLDSVHHGQGSEDTRMSNYKGRKQNKFNKRQGYNKQDRFAKKLKFENEIESNFNTSEPFSENHPEPSVAGAAVPSNHTPLTGKDDAASELRNKFVRKERVNNKFNKRGRQQKKGRFDKNHKFANRNQGDCYHAPRREPTLLKKLLAADVSRDQNRLLQAFRFMVMNSFFKDWPDKPLTYPSVIIDGVEHQCSAEDTVSPANGVSDKGAAKDFVSSNCSISGDEDEDEDEDEDDSDEHDAQDEDTFHDISTECNNGQSKEDEEEGEIVD